MNIQDADIESSQSFWKYMTSRTTKTHDEEEEERKHLEVIRVAESYRLEFN